MKTKFISDHFDDVFITDVLLQIYVCIFTSCQIDINNKKSHSPEVTIATSTLLTVSVAISIGQYINKTSQVLSVLLTFISLLIHITNISQRILSFTVAQAVEQGT